MLKRISHVSRRRFCKVASAAGACVLMPDELASSNESKSKTTAVVDTHMHVWAKDAIKYPFVHPYSSKFKEPRYEGTVEMLLEDMDANDVSHSILVQVIFHGWDNRYVADCVRQAPERFKAHGLIDPIDPKVADKLTYWMTEHPLAGMRFSPIYYRDGQQGGDDWITSESHKKLWQQAEKLGAVFNFFIATGQLTKLAKMVERFPGVPIIIDHIGQVDLGVAEVETDFRNLLAMARFPNVWVKVSELSSVSESGTYPFPDAWPWLERLEEAFGAERLLWGTGYPGQARADYQRPTLADELTLIREEIPFFSADDRTNILGGNAAELWKL